MQEIEINPLGSQGQVVAIDETFLGGKKTGKGVKAGKQAKIAILGIAEKNGRVHLQRIDNTKVSSIKPVLDQKLSPNASEVITDAAPMYTMMIPAEKHTEISHKQQLRNLGEISTKTVEGAF